MKNIVIAALSILLAASFPASAKQRVQAAGGDCQMRIADGWVRLLPGGMPMHAGFARIENPCGKAVEIVAATSPVYAEVELHETRREAGVSRMRQIHALPVSAHGQTRLQPGGLHLMLMRPQREIRPGEPVVIRFKLADGREVSGQFEARQP
ncbi:hypothetical protein CO614_01495 [Lysobacteraceae bacterium NML120232]|nr:hypothetical protein CO608_01320 [Xanthomonadaceae bacterium NML08-0793]PJK13370.1 hypothetical protein CO614_01495 [Xanthomonadaceae bacterium NML120232]